MTASRGSTDEDAIRAIVARQFASLGWTPERPADWDGFVGDFRPDAMLWPSARPAAPQSLAAFVERMTSLASTKLQSFEEAVLGSEVRVFGNVAVAVAACEMTENGTETSRGVEMMLLVRDGGSWRIVAQAWDGEGPENPIPAYLLEPGANRAR